MQTELNAQERGDRMWLAEEVNYMRIILNT